MTRRAAVAVWLALTFGCAAAEEPKSVGVGGSAKLVVIEGAPAEGALVPRAGFTIETEPRVLGTIGGVVAIGAVDGVWATSLGADALEEVRVHPDQEGPKSTGAVRSLARRSPDGVLVVAESGLFHSASGYLLSSPFGQSVDASAIEAISAFGADTDEELWVVTTGAAFWASGGELTEFSLEGAPAAISIALGAAPAQAVVAAGDRAYLADLRAGGAVELASDLGTVAGGAAEEDGTVHLATSAGLLSRKRSGELTLRTFAEPGAPPVPVVAVAAAFGSVFALTSEGLVSIDAAGARRIGDAAPPAASLAIDAGGDTWSLEGGGLYRYETGTPVSFGADVAPFFAEHCQSCHDAGATTAPDHDFTDYETAKEWSDSIARRLLATDATTMPPPNEEVLTASEYAVVLRWVNGGMLP
jgi:hypothetical protein